MGLWGSKQQKEINIQNPVPEGQVFVTQNAIDNVIKSNKETDSNGSSKSQQQSDNASGADVIDSTLSDLADKRISEYERHLLANFEQASKEVETLFKERYQTVPVCLDLQKTVSECYTNYKEQPLKCLDISNQFLKCIEKERQTRFGLSPSSK